MIVNKKYKINFKPPVGIEPTIYCLEGSRLIHWATGAKKKLSVGLEPTIYRLEGGRLIHWATRAKVRSQQGSNL